MAKGGPAAGGASARPAKPTSKVAPEPKKPVVVSPVPVAKPDGRPAADGADRKKPKGITIVTPKPVKKTKPKKVIEIPRTGEPLLGAKSKWKPLIPSGPKAPPIGGSLGRPDAEQSLKSSMPRREQEKYKAILIRKRAELVGDVRTMEGEALTASSGSLSHLPQHMAEQGSEAYDQSLQLDLAAVDRSLIKEIDDALARIEAGTYGVCELTAKPISRERLDELPWTRYSIEAARELERRSYRA